MTEQLRPIEVSRAVILDDSQRVLLGRRSSEQGNGQWALLGGKKDGAETPETTVIREVLEEAGLEIEPQYLGAHKQVDEDSAAVWWTYYYGGEAKGDLQSDGVEHSELRYFGVKELDAIDIAWGARPVIKEMIGKLLAQRSDSSGWNAR